MEHVWCFSCFWTSAWVLLTKDWPPKADLALCPGVYKRNKVANPRIRWPEIGTVLYLRVPWSWSCRPCWVPGSCQGGTELPLALLCPQTFCDFPCPTLDLLTPHPRLTLGCYLSWPQCLAYHRGLPMYSRNCLLKEIFLSLNEINYYYWSKINEILQSTYPHA